MGNGMKTQFQCPGTGQDVEASYVAGKLYLNPSKSSVHYDAEEFHGDEEELQRITEKTEEWCEKHSGRFSSVDAVVKYLKNEAGVPGLEANRIRPGW